MKPEFKIFRPGSIVEDSVDEGHDGGLKTRHHVRMKRFKMQIKLDLTHLQADIIPVFAKTPVQVVNNALEPCPLTGKCLIVQHRLQHLLVAAGYKAQGPKDLQHGHLGLDVLRAKALGDGIDPGDVGEDVRPANGVVHDGLDAAKGGGVDGGLGGVPVHPGQQVQETCQAGGLQEPGHEAVRLRPERDLEAVKTPTPLMDVLVRTGKLQLKREK